MKECTLVIVNPFAGSGRAFRAWSKLEPMLIDAFGDLVVAITRHPEEIVEHLDKAYAAGLTRVIAVGGDGTAFTVMNAVLEFQKTLPPGQEILFGQLPMGTGQDFGRHLGIPRDPALAIQWLVNARPKPLDLGCLEFDGRQRRFLNVASVGMGGEIDKRVNRMTVRRPWTFWVETVRAFLTYTPPWVSVRLDGDLWYEGRAWIVAVANASSFGRGMLIAPDARIDDGLLDVVLVQDMPRLTAIKAFNSVYSGKHLLRDDVRHQRASTIEIQGADGPLPIDLDGEYTDGQNLRFFVQPGALRMLA